MPIIGSHLFLLLFGNPTSPALNLVTATTSLCNDKLPFAPVTSRESQLALSFLRVLNSGLIVQGYTEKGIIDADLLPRPVESRKQFHTERRTPRMPFWGESGVWTDARRTAVNAMMQNSMEPGWARCSMLHDSREAFTSSLCGSRMPLTRADRADYESRLAAEGFPQRSVHFQSAIVVNVPLLPEPVHEEIDSRSRGPHHFRQNLMA